MKKRFSFSLTSLRARTIIVVTVMLAHDYMITGDVKERAMYAAKAAGRNRVSAHTDIEGQERHRTS
ncbi:MAG: hypothetical protein Q8L35_04115 [Actinomycetota bacterium]|nr:hypothetical protein [Actinomycetota bacterium]